MKQIYYACVCTVCICYYINMSNTPPAATPPAATTNCTNVDETSSCTAITSKASVNSNEKELQSQNQQLEGKCMHICVYIYTNILVVVDSTSMLSVDGAQMYDGEVLFLVSWKSQPVWKKTWEKSSNVPLQLLQQFYVRLKENQIMTYACKTFM